MNTELRDRIADFVQFADEMKAEYYAKHYPNVTPPTHRADFISDKWCRVVNVERGQTASVYCFICLQDYENRTLGRLKTGDIHKPASFKTPARHSRGTVFTGDWNRTAGPFGMAYLR